MMRYEYPNIVDKEGQINSIYPPTGYLTFGPWIYLVPQYKPTNVLVLGYAGSTVSGLIHLFYPNVEITGVDIDVIDPVFYPEDTIIQADARDFIKDSGQYDTIIVDIFEDGSVLPPAFVYEQAFADLVKSKANYLIVNANEVSDMSAYGKPFKVLSLNTSRFYYYKINDIPSLPVR